MHHGLVAVGSTAPRLMGLSCQRETPQYLYDVSIGMCVTEKICCVVGQSIISNRWNW